MKQIELLANGDERIDYADWPVTQGIPFADGEMPRGTPVRIVDEAGQPLPTQATCLVTWHKDLKYVRWLLVDFQIDQPAGTQRKLTLQYGPDVQPAVPELPVRIEQHPDQEIQRIDTGALRLDLRQPADRWQAPRACDVFAGCQISTDAGWQDVFGRDPGPFLTMQDQHGNRYDTCTRAPRPIVTVEDAGPVRASVCIRGYQATLQGQRFCPYILRLHLFAGRRDIRVHHTFVFDQEPHFIELAAMGVSIPLALGTPQRMAIGGDDKAHDTTDATSLHYLQTDDQTHTVTADGKEIGAGAKSRGWAMLNGERGSAVTVIRDAWQEYPKGLSIQPGRIDVEIWPERHGQTMKFTTPFTQDAVRFDDADPKIVDVRDEAAFVRRLDDKPGAPLNLKSLHPRDLDSVLWVEQMVEKHAGGRAVSYNDTGSCTGIGAARTTEIHLRLSPDALTDDDAERFAAMAQQPVIAPAGPAHVTATKALGETHHADGRFPEIDDLLDKALYRTTTEMNEFCRRYGMWRHGNVACGHSKVAPTLAYNHHFQQGNPDKALRWVGVFHNEACDEIMGMWSNFVRTGRRDQFMIAQGYSRAVADVGFIHASPDDAGPDIAGLMHYHNAHPFSGGTSPSHSLITGILWDYYFTGNRRLLDVARENADWAVRNQTPAGLVSNPADALHREFTGPIWSLLEMYQTTWEERYADVARRSLNWFWRTISIPGVYPTSVYTRGERGDEALVDPDPKLYTGRHRTARHWSTPVWALALRLLDCQPLRDHIVAEAHTLVWDAPLPAGSNYMHPVVCLAYRITGDFVYAAYARQLLEYSTIPGLQHMCEQVPLGNYTQAVNLLRLRHTVVDAMDRDLDALAEADVRLKARQKELETDPVAFTDLPKVGTAASIGVLSTADHPGAAS